MRRVTRTHSAPFALALLTLLLLAACAAGPGSEWARTDPPAGFFTGLWHGLILVVALVVSFFTGTVRVYETHNVGTAYDIGFVLGTMLLYGSGIRITFHRARRRGHVVVHPTSDDVAGRVEKRVRQKLSGLLTDDELDQLGEKVVRDVRARLRRWLEDDEDDPTRPPPTEPG